MKKKYINGAYAVLAVIWLAAGLIIGNAVKIGINFWGGLAAGLIAIIVSVVLTVLRPVKSNDATTEVNTVPYAFSFIYIILSMIVNVICMLMADSRKGFVILIAVNVVLLAIFAYLFTTASQSALSVAEKTEVVSAKTNNTANFSMMLASLLGIAKDEEVKKAIYALKQKVDYSSNTSQSFTREIENEFEQALQTVGDAIRQDREKNEIIEAIKSAEGIWNDRNTRKATVR